MKCVTLPGGELIPAMGQGTWRMAERAERRSDEIAALRAGVDPTLETIARDIGATPTQVALAWTMQHKGVIAIPKAGSVVHVRENRAAADIVLSDTDLATLDAAFPRPRDRHPLEML